MSQDRRPLIAHVLYRFDTGGLENGVVNLINHLPHDKYRHAIIALTEITAFRQRIQRKDVEFIALHKKPGHGFWLYPELFRLFRKLRPGIVHTRNLAALEAAVPAWLAGVPGRLHSEHGREGADLDPAHPKYRLMRRLYRPFVTNYLALSADLSHYLSHYIGIPEHKLSQIYNGVDSKRFFGGVERQPIPDCPFQSPAHWFLGTIGRMHVVKDQMNLAQAVACALDKQPDLRRRLRLLMIGDGPERTRIESYLKQSGLTDIAWTPGERDDAPAILRGLDCFVLPSKSEGISNTILEAMATSLPVIATDVGGNPELVQAGLTGKLVAAEDPAALADAIIDYANHPDSAKQAGMAGRKAVESKFSLDAMIKAYCALYDGLLPASPQASHRPS
ncbi:MAG: TIGR03088 family PEP-CTERM/XrtA system glycosyltransferase [Rhodocyclales bacterium GT-UBC]|nr:MAG: TIGR03088 family PEP-CTERM/XrtA system glycosyltransferase [Rhodocyclales bacterium GT-UBC]